MPLSDTSDMPPDEPSFWDRLDETMPAESADWSGDELEAAYLKAMEALEAAEAELTETPDLHETPESEAVSELEAAPVAGLSRSTEVAPQAASTTEADRDLQQSEVAADLEQLANRRAVDSSGMPPAMLPRQILEACLFVGGPPLTSKKLSGVLRGEFSTEYIERELDELNRLYSAEGRPYEIRLVEGGYRLTLRDEYERIRHKTYGLGPKEVRLSQEALEVLAVVAYHQPISATAIEELGKTGSGSVLRQLLRRELIAVERPPEQSRDVVYRTTPRFLSLFGIRSLDELPRHEQVSYK